MRDERWSSRDQLRILMIQKFFPKATMTEKCKLFNESAKQVKDASRTLGALTKAWSRIRDMYSDTEPETYMDHISVDDDDAYATCIANPAAAGSSCQAVPGYTGNEVQQSSLMYTVLPAPVAQMSGPGEVDFWIDSHLQELAPSQGLVQEPGPASGMNGTAIVETAYSNSWLNQSDAALYVSMPELEIGSGCGGASFSSSLAFSYDEAGNQIPYQ